MVTYVTNETGINSLLRCNTFAIYLVEDCSGFSEYVPLYMHLHIYINSDMDLLLKIVCMY